MFAWVPYVTADAGSLFGGWVSGHLISRGWSANRARKSVILFGMLCMCTGLLAAVAHTASAALAAIGVVLFGFQTWINNVQTLPSDFFPNPPSAPSPDSAEWARVWARSCSPNHRTRRDHFSYTPILIAAGLLPLLGTALLFVLGGYIKRVA